MNFRGRLRRLLLVATLLPLLISSGVFLLLLSGLGAHFASDTKDVLIERSHGHLQSLLRDSGRLAQQKSQLIDLVITGQIHALEKQLREEEKSEALQGLQPEDANNYPQVAKKTLPGEKLKSLAEDFQHFRRNVPDLILRQYVAFTSGQSYFLPRAQTELIPVDLSYQGWAVRPFQNHDTSRLLVNDIENHSLNLLVRAPLQDSAGTIWGMTAVEVPLADLFLPLEMPAAWQLGARVMLAARDSHAANLTIIAEAKSDSNWQLPPDSSGQDPALLGASAAILAEVAQGRSGVLMIKHQDEMRHWAYGSLLWGEYFTLVMLEHDRVVSFALESEQHVLGKTKLGMTFVGIGLLVFIGLSIIAAARFSQEVTEPVRTLSSAFEQLAKGDFTTRVTIETGDEIEALGNSFNDLGGKLADRNRMATSLALAREVQQHLLPRRPPIIVGLDLFSRGIPCDEIGGDYYDFISPKDNSKTRLGIVVGDVSGHGVPAALLMAAARGILRSHAWCHGGDLAFLFQLLNRQLAKDSANDHFMTLFYGIIDREEGTLSWNSAGHGPVLLYRSQSQLLIELEPTGPPLGIDETLSYEPQMVVNLEPGDILLAGTDGIWEARNQAGESWGIETFRSRLLQVTTESAFDIGEFLFKELTDFRAGQKQEDDISLVIAKLTAAELFQKSIT